MKTYTLTWDSRGYKIYVNNELISSDYTSGLYTFKKGDVINVDNNSTEAYDFISNTWTNTAYRTLIFENAPTDDLLTWLQANGTKQ